MPRGAVVFFFFLFVAAFRITLRLEFSAFGMAGACASSSRRDPRELLRKLRWRLDGLALGYGGCYCEWQSISSAARLARAPMRINHPGHSFNISNGRLECVSFPRIYFWSSRLEGTWSSPLLGVAGPSAWMIRVVRWSPRPSACMRRTIRNA